MHPTQLRSPGQLNMRRPFFPRHPRHRLVDLTTPIPFTATVANQLAEIARHLTLHRPTDVMQEPARMILALHTAGSAPASRPLLRLMPQPTSGITRGEYALHLYRIAGPDFPGGAR